MANSGSFNTRAYEVRYLTFNWSVASQSIDGNYSVINWNLRGAGGNTTSWYMAGNFQVVINGSVVYSSSSRIQLKNGTIVASGNATIYHNADGTKSFSASAQAGIYTYAVNCSGSGSWALPTIARATQPSVNKTSVTYGESVVISLPRASSNFTHTIQAGVDGKLYFTNIATGVSTSYTWTIPKDWAKYLPTKSHKIRVRAITYSGNTQIGTKEASSISVSPTSDMNPIVSIAISDDMKLKDKYGGFVKGQSKIRAKVSEKLHAGTSVSSRTLSLNGVNYQTAEQVSEVIVSTSQIVSATVTDARGLTGSASITPTVYDWFTPKIGSFRAERCNEKGKTDEVGNYIRIDYAVEIAPVNNKNTKSLKYGYKKQSDTSWATKAIAFSGYSNSGSVIIPASGEYSWDISIELQDDFTKAALFLQVGTAYVLMDFHKSGRGIAIGKVAEKENCLDIKDSWSVRVHGKEILDYVYPIGSIYLSVNSMNPATLFGGKWEQLKDRFLLGAGVYSNGSIGGESAHTLSISELPSHAHDTPFFNNMIDNGEMKSDFIGVFGKGMTASQATKETGKSVLEMWWVNQTNAADGNEPSYLTSAKGGNKAHNNMPPYLVVYMWKRIG